MEKSEKTNETQKRIIQNDGIIRFKERLEKSMGRMTNVELARLCGISETAVRTYLKGKSLPTIDKAAAIAEACNVDLTWLITGAEPVIPSSEIVKINESNNNKSMNEIQSMLNDLSKGEIEIIKNFLIREGINGLLRVLACKTLVIDDRSIEAIVNALPLRPVLKNAIKIGLQNNGEFDREILRFLEGIESTSQKDELNKTDVG